MRKIHLILQARGTFGKTTVAVIIADYKHTQGHSLLCLDANSDNPTLVQYASLEAQSIDLVDNETVQPKRFDNMMDRIRESSSDVIIDTGSTTFRVLMDYLKTNQVADLLHDMDCQLTLHTLITGGPSLQAALDGFNQLVQQFPQTTRFIVWLNPILGPIEYQSQPFHHMKDYIDNANRLYGIVNMPKLELYFLQDFNRMLSLKYTFNDAINSTQFDLFSKQRLVMIQRDLASWLNLMEI